jgi:hypothetical protein
MIMGYGSCQLNMSSILNDLNIDKEDFDWFDFAVCRGMDTNLFFDQYETDINIAKNIDEACISCPVKKSCLSAGQDNNEYGVWGGVYLSSGSVDANKNIHKTPEVWKRIKK